MPMVWWLCSQVTSQSGRCYLHLSFIDHTSMNTAKKSIGYWQMTEQTSAEINLPRTWPSEFAIPVDSRPICVRTILKRCIIDGWTMRVIDWYFGKTPVPFLRSTWEPQPLHEDHGCPSGNQNKMATPHSPTFQVHLLIGEQCDYSIMRDNSFIIQHCSLTWFWIKVMYTNVVFLAQL